MLLEQLQRLIGVEAREKLGQKAQQQLIDDDAGVLECLDALAGGLDLGRCQRVARRPNDVVGQATRPDALEQPLEL